MYMHTYIYKYVFVYIYSVALPACAPRPGLLYNSSTYLLSYPQTWLPMGYLGTLPTYLPTCLPVYLHTYCPPTCLPA